MVGSLQALLELQEVDLARDRLNERKEKLPEKAELADLTARMREVQAAIERVEADQAGVIKEIDRLEAEIKTIEEKIAREEHKMYSGAVVNPREIVALTDEVEMLKRRKAPLEEEEIERLVERDELSARKDGMREELASLEQEATAVRDRIAALTAEIDGELAVEDQKRAGLVPMVPDDVLDTYESLREQKRGVGVGALTGGICSACHEALSAVEVDRIKRKAREGESLFRCEHCRRLLVVT